MGVTRRPATPELATDAGNRSKLSVADCAPNRGTAAALEMSLDKLIDRAATVEPASLDPLTAARCRNAELRLLAGAIETDSGDVLHERGVRFHETIVGSSKNPFFLETIRRINCIRRLLSYRSMVDRKRYRQQCEEHLEILDLQAEKNEEASQAASPSPGTYRRESEADPTRC
jgi:DNA-binding GntR family transcriptional regulator